MNILLMAFCHFRELRNEMKIIILMIDKQRKCYEVNILRCDKPEIVSHPILIPKRFKIFRFKCRDNLESSQVIS